MSQPTIDVLIPFHNRSQYLEDCLDSIKMQSHSNFRIVIVNDGSAKSQSEKLLEIVEKYQGKLSIEVYENEKNSGVVVTRNRLLDLVKSDYYTFLDDDDMLCGRYSIEYRLDFLLNNPEYDVVVGSHIIIDQAGKVLNSRSPERVSDMYRASTNDPQFLRQSFFEYYFEKNKLFFYLMGSGLIRSKLAKKYRFNSEFTHSEDIDYIGQILGAGVKFKLELVPFFLRRRHETQGSKLITPEEENIVISQLRKYFTAA